MITLAFAQLVYYFGVGLDRYGADDGLTVYRRSQFGDLVNLSNRTVFYYLCLLILVGTIYLVWRLINSRFGMVVQGARSNDRRMRAIGFPTYRYRLTCFVIAGILCGLAGVLLANHTDFINPAMMHWTRSGDLIVMAVLGGMGTVLGPMLGALALLMLEEVLSGITEYWQIIIGLAGHPDPAHVAELHHRARCAECLLAAGNNGSGFHIFYEHHTVARGHAQLRGPPGLQYRW